MSFRVVTGLCLETEVIWRYKLTEKRTRTVRSSRMNNCARLIINVLELFWIIMKAYVTTVIRGDGPEKEGEPVVMKGDNMSAMYRVRSCHGGNDVTRAGGLMRLVRVLEDRRFQAKHVKGINNTLEDGLTNWDPSMLTEDLT